MSFKNTDEISRFIDNILNKNINMYRRCVHMCASFYPLLDYNLKSLESP